MFNADEELLGLDEAAIALKIHRATLYRYVREGRIAVMKHGRRTFIEKAEIDNYWSRKREEADAVRVVRASENSENTPAASENSENTPAAGRRASSTASRRTAA